MPLTEESTKSYLKDYFAERGSLTPKKDRASWKSFLEKHHHSDSIYVRPSGNPLSNEETIDMYCDDNVNGDLEALVEIDTVTVVDAGNVAIVTCTVDQIFTYHGTLNEDRSTFTFVIAEVEGDPKVMHTHRGTGQPLPK